MPNSFVLSREGVALAGRDYGDHGPAVLLLHGLAGHAGEWADTASWLAGSYRVVALDSRGHGESERRPDDVSLKAQSADAAFVIEQLELGPTVVIGQSIGGQVALLVAADRADLVRGLVVVEADPNEGDKQSVDEVVAWLASWPVPFPSREAALEFFDGSPGRAKAWADGLALRDGGLWPRFEIDLMARTLTEAAARSYWAEWESLRCPILVVRAQNDQLSQATAQRMLERGGIVALRAVSGAGHDVHLDRPLEWRDAVGGFLDSL